MRRLIAACRTILLVTLLVVAALAAAGAVYQTVSVRRESALRLAIERTGADRIAARGVPAERPEQGAGLFLAHARDLDDGDHPCRGGEEEMLRH